MALGISVQPVSQAYKVGDSITLSITATGRDPIYQWYIYQWYKNSAILTGKTARTLVLSPAVIGDAGSYTCLVTMGPVTIPPETILSNPAILSLDSIVSAITRNRKAVLAAMSVIGGYSFTPAVVEEPRIARNVNGRYPYMEIIKAPIEPSTEGNTSEHTTIAYLVIYEDQYNDDEITSEEILYHFRNVTADIVRAWMVDRTCGGLAQFTRTEWYDDAIINSDGLNVYRAAVVFEVDTLIDSSNPFLRG